MIGALKLAEAIKGADISAPICFCGSHTQALPYDVLSLNSVDLILLNEGVYALNNLLASNLSSDLSTIKGIGHKIGGKPTLNSPERIVPQDRMDEDLPGYAWELLPYKSKPSTYIVRIFGMPVLTTMRELLLLQFIHHLAANLRAISA